MVAENGFSGGALNIARAHGIETYTLTDTRRDGWAQKIRIHIAIEIATLRFKGWKLQNEDGSDFTFQTGEPLRLKMFDAAKPGKEISFDDLLRELWSKGGSPEGSLEFKNSLTAIGKDGQPVKLQAILHVDAEIKGYVRPANLELLGLLDASDGQTHTDAFKMATDPSAEAIEYTARDGWREHWSNFGALGKTTFVEIAGQEHTLNGVKNRLLKDLLTKGIVELSATTAGPMKLDVGKPTTS